MEAKKITFFDNLCCHSILAEKFSGVDKRFSAQIATYFSGYKTYTNEIDFYGEMQEKLKLDFFKYFDKLNSQTLVMKARENIKHIVVSHDGQNREIDQFFKEINNEETNENSLVNFISCDNSLWSSKKTYKRFLAIDFVNKINKILEDIESKKKGDKIFVIYNSHKKSPYLVHLSIAYSIGGMNFRNEKSFKALFKTTKHHIRKQFALFSPKVSFFGLSKPFIFSKTVVGKNVPALSHESSLYKSLSNVGMILHLRAEHLGLQNITEQEIAENGARLTSRKDGVLEAKQITPHNIEVLVITWNISGFFPNTPIKCAKLSEYLSRKICGQEIIALNFQEIDEMKVSQGTVRELAKSVFLNKTKTKKVNSFLLR